MTGQIKICKYCGERIPHGEVWNPDQNGNGYHHACLINMQLKEDAKRAERLAQNSILDEIRAEIEKLPNMNEVGVFSSIRMKRMVLEIIDKYKAESEDKG